MAPQWSNVYNRVSVSLTNQEFNQLTTKEVAAGEYLNRMSAVTINQDADEVLSWEAVVGIAALDTAGVVNNQNAGTSLFIADESHSLKTERLLLQ